MRITITIQDSNIAPETAAKFASDSIQHWRQCTKVGKPWSPGAIIIFDAGIVTSTAETSAGWTVKVAKTS
jgi:hypothetical protein